MKLYNDRKSILHFLDLFKIGIIYYGLQDLNKRLIILISLYNNTLIFQMPNSTKRKLIIF